ncbi:MAG: hypothetical protein ABW186_18060 [Rhodanobacteraceae bacterium]
MNNETLHPALAELPVFEPDTALWSRIASAHEMARKPVAPIMRRRPWRLAAGFATAAALVVAVIATLPRDNVEPASIVEGQRESQTLESEWRELTPVAMTRPAAGIARLHMIDAALQAAYDRGAEPAELKPLWQQRNDALRGLILVARTDEVTRI